MRNSQTYTISEAAGLTGLHRNTIRQKIKLGQLEATVRQGKYGEEYRIPRAALIRAGLLEPAEGDEPAADTPVAPRSEPLTPQAAPTPAAPEPDGTIAALSDLYQRHEQAMFRLGYLQGELERLKALEATAESLRHEGEARSEEVRALRSELEERERQAREAEALRVELEQSRARLSELESLRRDLEHLKSLAGQQERLIEALEAETRKARPWWRFWSR